MNQYLVVQFLNIESLFSFPNVGVW